MKEETILKAKFRRSDDHWKMIHNSRSHTPTSYVIEGVENLFEAGHTEINVNMLYDTANTGFSILCGGNNGMPVTPEYIRDNVMVDSVDSHKTIGLHGGTGIKTAACSQIFEVENGYLVFAARNNDTNKHVGFIWDGKTDNIENDGIISIEDTEYELKEYDSYFGLTKSLATESDISATEEALAKRFAKPLIEGRVKITLNGAPLNMVDFILKRLFKDHPEYSKYCVNEKIEVRGKCNKKYIAVVTLLTTFPMWKDGVLQQYLPYYFLTDSGEPDFSKFGIAVGDENYFYVFPNKNILKASNVKKAYENMDRHILGTIILPTEYFKENAHPDSNKLLGIPDIDKKQSLMPVFDWIRKTAAQTLNQCHRDKSFLPLESETEENKIGEVPTIRANGIYYNKFGDTVTMEYDKERGIPVINIPEEVLPEGADMLNNDAFPKFVTEVASAGSKSVEEIVTEVANALANKSKSNHKVMMTFMKMVRAKVQAKYPKKIS